MAKATTIAQSMTGAWALHKARTGAQKLFSSLFFMLIFAPALADTPASDVPPETNTIIEESNTSLEADGDSLAQEPLPAPTETEPLIASESELEENQPVTEEQEDGRIALGIEGLEREETQRFLAYFLTTGGKKLLVQSLQNSVPYRPYIIQQLKEKNLPLYLQYLPIVESNYVPSAISKSGATGIWQFMENSMRPFLTKDSWYDDRRDPWKATDAALAKLVENYNTFGSWELALAAYNCGSGAMARIVKQHPDKDFWDLAESGLLKQQTAQYVPKLIAITDIIENAEYYGAQDVLEAKLLIEGKEVEEFDYVTTTGMLSFNQIAELTGIEKAHIKTLNQALFRNCTPAGQAYKLRLPKGSGEEAESKLKDAGIATDALIYTVTKGDTLWGISRRYKITVADLCAVNGIKENGILSIGKKLVVPIFK